MITTDLEHNSVLRPLYRLEAAGDISLSFVRADRQGKINIADFKQLIRPETRAIVCTHASNLTGNAIDLVSVGQIADNHQILFVVEASQTAGSLPIDMEAMRIDVLCTTGHKGLLGPQGTGCLCLREGVAVRPFKVGGSGVQSYNRFQPTELPTRLEAGTLNTHGIYGLSAGLDFIREIGRDAIHAREILLMRRFLAGLSEIPNVKAYGNFHSDTRAAIVAINIGDIDSAIIADELSHHYQIATRPGAHCAPRMHDALGTTEQGAVRFSFGWSNTEAEVDEALRALRELADS